MRLRQFDFGLSFLKICVARSRPKNSHKLRMTPNETVRPKPFLFAKGAI